MRMSQAPLSVGGIEVAKTGRFTNDAQKRAVTGELFCGTSLASNMLRLFSAILERFID
jgi:hypothetical protein